MSQKQKTTNGDTNLEQTLRPAKWNDYVGQEPIKKNLFILMRAAKDRNEALEHVLFHGPAGLGKTSLAHLVAKEMEAQIKITSGPAIERVGDLASILTNLSTNDILFIDEIHRLNKAIEEVLYPAMESRTLDIIIGKGPGARSIQLDLPAFTLVAATTRMSLLSNPLRSRFSGGTFRLDYYTTDELTKIIERSSEILKTKISNEAASLISFRSRFTPRISNRLLKRARDYAQVHNISEINKDCVLKTLELLGIDSEGLEDTDRRLLKILIEKFNGGPVGLNTLSAASSEETGTVEEVYEPFLLRLGFIERTPRGRVATPRAYEHLGLGIPQTKLI